MTQHMIDFASLLLTVSLVPSIRHHQPPAQFTCEVNCVALLILGLAYAQLHFLFAFAVCTVQLALWFVLYLQRFIK